MLQSTIRSVVRSFTKSETSHAVARSRTILRVETLEKREVPATWTVTNTNATGDGSLSAAVTAANTDPMSADATINITVMGTIGLTNPLNLMKNITINGNDVAVTRAAGAGNFRIFSNSGQSNINHLTVDNGRDDQGAGIRNGGTLTLDHVTVSNNQSVGLNGQGGGIYNNGTLHLLYIDIKSNKAQDGAGFTILAASWTRTT